MTHSFNTTIGFFRSVQKHRTGLQNDNLITDRKKVTCSQHKVTSATIRPRSTQIRQTKTKLWNRNRQNTGGISIGRVFLASNGTFDPMTITSPCWIFDLQTRVLDFRLFSERTVLGLWLIQWKVKFLTHYFQHAKRIIYRITFLYILEFRSPIRCFHLLERSTSDSKSLPWFLKRYELSANWSRNRIPNPYNEPVIIFIVFVLLNWSSSAIFHRMWRRSVKEISVTIRRKLCAYWSMSSWKKSIQ